ncbi:MAG TPA: hypothetical protein VHB48_10270 [Chitinophagaceae bacterium]|nr:hypothetical protein [Chitinophagaceae bacterium]
MKQLSFTNCPSCFSSKSIWFLHKASLKTKVTFKTGTIWYGEIIGTGGGIQAFQPAFTPTNIASVRVIKNISLYKEDPDMLSNFNFMRVYPEEVELIEKIKKENLPDK